MSSQNKFSRIIEIIFIFVVSALTYLPNLLRATIYRDDWYYVMDRVIGGAGVFAEMFSIDRPARAPLFELYYRLFGIEPLPYHLSSFLWRFLGALAALWLFNMLWPKQRRAALFMALLFALFPGYARWMEGFEDLPRMLGSCLQVFSIALTIHAIKSAAPAPKIAAWIASIITGWAAILLVDFSIGMEAFRLLCVFVLVSHNAQTLPLIKKGVLALRAWAIAVIIPVGFLVWRLLFFHGTRKQTDVGVQVGYLIASPLLTGASWVIRFVQSALNVAFLSWVASPLQGFFNLRLRDVAVGALIAVIPLVAMLLSDRFLPKEENDSESAPWQTEAILIGILGVMVGVLPVIIANRYVDFSSYSHYALPASLAGAPLIVGLVSSITSSRIRVGVFAALVLSAVLSHYSISAQIVDEQTKIGKFWQQVVWRAADIKAGTTLFVNYPDLDYGDNIDAVTGPANLIYYPEQTGQIPVVYPLYAILPGSSMSKQMLSGQNRMDGYRTHIGAVDYQNLLVMTQPSESACVHIIDSKWPLFSDDDGDPVLLVGAHSKIENILGDKKAPEKLDASIFGPEPAREWCYTFEKADFARQKGDWTQVAKLGDEALKSGNHPIDLVEWTPFLQAYAALGDEQNFKGTVSKIKSSDFATRQACDTLTKMQKTGPSFRPTIKTQIEKLCK